jgi:GNAT superfamily N-acetyltransferase
MKTLLYDMITDERLTLQDEMPKLMASYFGRILYLNMYFIKTATTADVGAIRKIAEETWWPTYLPILEEEQIRFMLDEIYAEEKITKQINSNEQTYLLLFEDEQPVAFAAYSPREENADIYKLHKIYSLPKTQGKGYGKLLINEVCKKVTESGKAVLELNVNRHNNARSFYEKMGFEVVYEEDIPIGLYWMNDYVMRKELLISSEER